MIPRLRNRVSRTALRLEVELERRRDGAKLAEGARFQLPDPLAGDAELDADLLERPTALAVEAEAEHQDALQAGSQLRDVPRQPRD